MGIKVYFNDSCNICRMEINHYKKIANSDLEWIDITNNDEAIKITSKSQKELLRRLHVINDGEVIGGAKAFIIICSMDTYCLFSHSRLICISWRLIMMRKWNTRS